MAATLAPELRAKVAAAIVNRIRILTAGPTSPAFVFVAGWLTSSLADYARGGWKDLGYLLLALGSCFCLLGLRLIVLCFPPLAFGKAQRLTALIRGY